MFYNLSSRASKNLLTAIFLLNFFNCFNLQARAKDENPSEKRYIVGISKKHKFVWFRVAKVASSTIKTIFARHNVKMPIQSSHFVYRPKKFKNYFKFAFVRNPWARVVSCYIQKVKNKDPLWAEYYGECFDKSFEYFVDFIANKDLKTADRHIRLQTTLIPVKEVNFIGKLENFDHDFQYVLSKIGINDHTIPKKNATKHVHYSHFYNQRTKEIIEQKYQDDIETFGYKFKVK